MAINLVTFAAQTVTPQDDALIYESALTGSGMIYGGEVTIKSANVLHVAEGHGALCGRKFTIEGTDVPIALTPSGSLLGRIYIHMDLADTDEPISIKVETASSLTPVIQDSDVNINNGVYEINLATFDVDTSAISNLVNVSPIIKNITEDLSTIRATGSTNATGGTITSGTYFYLNNILVVAIQNISNGASFTRNTNYEEVTAGALNKKGGVNFNRAIASFTGAYTGSPISGNVDYTLTEDSWLHIEASIGGGYLQAFANSNKLLANWANYVSTSAVNFSDWVLMPKGTRVTMTLTPNTNKVYSWSLQFYAAF